MRRRLVIVFVTMIAAFAFTATPVSAESAGPTATTITADGRTSAGEALTCNYVAWAPQGINQHERPDRSSPVKWHYDRGHMFFGAPCTNVEGGNYASCGTGNLWKSWGSYWLPTKCLKRA